MNYTTAHAITSHKPNMKSLSVSLPLDNQRKWALQSSQDTVGMDSYSRERNRLFMPHDKYTVHI